MTVLNSGISWTTGTLNLVVGCTHVSAACDNCYAETFVNRGLHGSRDFETLRYYPNRLNDIRKFEPKKGPDGLLEPQMLFINSLGDFWHEKIPQDFIENALHAFEQHPNIIFQILTKRPGRMRRIITARYGNRPVPSNFWIGVTCEDNRVKRGLDILRGTKEKVGDFTAFASIEPITAPCDQIDLTGIDWVLTGGESGGNARPMKFEWLQQIHDKISEAEIPLHFKQYGTPANNPMVQREIKLRGGSPTAALKRLIESGRELAPHEKGGATYEGHVIQEKPAHFHQLKASLNA